MGETLQDALYTAIYAARDAGKLNPESVEALKKLAREIGSKDLEHVVALLNHHYE